MDHVSALRREGTALLIGAQAAGLDAPIEACPDWDMTRLLRHVARVHERTEMLVRQGLLEPPGRDAFAELPRDESLLDVYSEILDRLITTLSGADPTGPSWNFTDSNQTNAFWFRRMAHETAIHRWDAEVASDATTEFATDLALDGIEEFLTVLLPMSTARTSADFSGTVHLHATDGDGEWLTTFTEGRPDTRREHAKGDLAVRGPASSLYLWSWNRRRVGDGELEAFGDLELLDRWRAVVP